MEASASKITPSQSCGQGWHSNSGLCQINAHAGQVTVSSKAGIGERNHHPLWISVAVGTIITDRPPHRTVRAALPHTAPTLEDWRAMLLLAHRTILGTLTSPHCVGLVLDRTMFSLARTLFSPGSAEDRS